MAIYLKVKVEYGNLMDIKEKFHMALVGTEAYQNSSIAIVDGDDENEFILCVGDEGNSIGINLIL